MNERDMLFSVEEQALFLRNSVALMRILTTELSNGLVSWQGELRSNCADWALERCNGFFVLLRDLEHISEDLDKTVNTGFEVLKNTAQAVETGR